MRFSNEMKAGLVITAAIAVGIFFFAKTATFKQATYELKTYFTYAGDLKVNAVVKLAGIEVGRVKAIKFVYQPDTKVECILEIDADGKVRSDSIAYIGTAGFVGDAYVGITGGKSGEFVKAGNAIVSEDPVQMRVIMKKAESIADNLDNILAEVKSLVTDNRPEFDNIIGNIESTTENFKEFSDDLKKHPWKLLFKGD